MLELTFAVFASLFSLVNPMGAVPVFLAMTPHYTQAERRRTALHTSLYFTLILLAFFFAGTLILSFFGLSINAMRIAGGLVILASGFSLLNGKFAEGRAIDRKVKEEALVKDDISFSPLAMPMLSGPGSISYLIGVFASNPGWDARSGRRDRADRPERFPHPALGAVSEQSPRRSRAQSHEPHHGLPGHVNRHPVHHYWSGGPGQGAGLVPHE